MKMPAMKAAAETGNGAVFVPRGRYLIKGHLVVPEGVMLEGIFRAPSARTLHSGSVLLAVAGAGDAKGQPFITLHTSCTLRGLTIFYPEQKMTNPPVEMDLGKAQLTLEPEVEAALVFGNRLREKQLITNRAGSCAQIGMNVVSKK